MLRLAISFSLIVGSLSHSLQPGPCPRVTVDPINLDKVTGVWLEYKRSLNNWDNSEKCAKAIWYRPHDGIAKVVLTSASKITNITSTIVGEALLNHYAIGINFYLPILGTKYAEHWVLRTDYINYSVVWSCKNYGLSHTSYAWFLSRTPKPTVDIDEIARNVFKEKKLTPLPMIKVNQDDDCFHKF